MNKILGIFGLLIFVCLFTTILSDSFDTAYNLYNVTRWSALFGIISIGVAFVIITGGIDLSIGSIVCLCGCLLSIFMMDYGWSVYTSVGLVMLIALTLGWVHGMLITKLQLQPFVVTLCGLLVYRGFARWFAEDQPQGFGQVHNEGIRQLAIGKPWKGFECDLAALMTIVGAIFATYFLIRFIWGRSKQGEAQAGQLIGLGFSALVATIGSSQFWGGENDLVLNIAGNRLTLAPGPLMFLSGILIFVPTSILFVWTGLRHDARRTIWPTITMAVCSLLFLIVTKNVAPIFDTITPGDTTVSDYGWLSTQGNTMRNLIMVLVFLTTGTLMGSIGWLASAVAGTGKSAQALLVTVIVSGVIWLMGMTKLPETPVPMPLLILVACAIVASIFLNQTIFGRYLLALGRNEEAARYSGINTDRMIILAYVICAGMAGLGAVLFAVDINNMQPANHGNIYELYAIAGAVLGGCSLRGGEGSIVGVIIGAAVMRVLYNAINTLGIDTKLEWVVIGVVILTGVIADEVVKRIVAARRAKLQAQSGS